jgi:hypothetical protein
MYGDVKNCAYGLIDRIPFILFHEETETVPYNFVALKLNSFEGHEFFVDFVGLNVLHGKKHAFMQTYARDLSSKTHFKQMDFLYLNVPRSEYLIDHLDTSSKFMRSLSNFLLFLIPTFCIIFFNNDFKWNGIYWLQFGVVFNMLSNVTWSMLEQYLVHNEHTFLIYIMLIMTLALSVLLSDKKDGRLVKIWQVWVVIDYVLMALLMQDKGTFFYCLVNVLTFALVAYFVKKNYKEIRNDELQVSFCVSLSLLTQLGNIWYYTTSLNRVFLLLARHQIHDKNPVFYYLIFGMIFTFMAISRIFLNEFVSWNADARILVSTYDEDQGVPLDGTVTTELQGKLVGDQSLDMSRYETEED